MKVSELRDEIRNKNDGVAPKHKVNIAIAAIIISYLLFIFLFAFDDYSVWFTVRLIIIGAAFIWVILIATGNLDKSTKFGKYSYSLIDFLSPQNPKEALNLLKNYAFLGIIILGLSLFGPWFTYEGEWEHEFDDSWYDTQYGHSFSDRYGLWSVKSVQYDYWDWGSYSRDSEIKNYADFNGFQNRQEVGLVSLSLVIVALTIWGVSSIICLYRINKNISNLEPQIKDLKETSQLQKRILQFNDKLEYLKLRNIKLSSFNKKVEEISKIKFNNQTQNDVNLRFILYAYLTCCTIAIGIALVACILFSQNWAEAMHTENGGDDGVCIVCENVDSFTGIAYTTEGTSSGTYYISIFWGGGWGRGIILWLGSLSFLGIFVNSLALHNLTKSSIKEIETLDKKSKEFKIPDFFNLV